MLGRQLRLDFESQFNRPGCVLQIESWCWDSRSYALGHIIDLGCERVDIIRRWQFRPDDLSVARHDLERHGFRSVGESSEIEMESCILEVQFESVRERTTGPIDHT